MKALAPILVLAVVAAILGSLLAITAHFTTPRIEENRTHAEEIELEGLRTLLDSRIEDLNLTERQLEECDYRVEITQVTSRGYGGDMEIATAFLGSSLVGVRIVSHRETPGFADALDPADWISSFGIRPLDEIDVVSRATITTRTVLEAVRQQEAQQFEAIQACTDGE